MMQFSVLCRFSPLVFLPAILGCAASAAAADLDQPPIRYATAPVDNPVSRLQQRIDAGQVLLNHEEHFGYLRSLLRELHVPVSSQTLVFSKTSFQRQRISPRTPRAVYFGDEAYVGMCQNGEVLEVTAVDPQLGAVFYSLGQARTEKPRFVRQNDDCLICHASFTQGFPGHLVRSLYTDADGIPILSLGSYRIDHASPLEKRWGGWYVTGTSGKQGHRGNLVLMEDNPPEPISNPAGSNVTDLRNRFNTAAYLSPHSDIVALMVLEHQAELHNRIGRATLEIRLALHEEAEINKILGRPAGYRSETTVHRIAAVGEPLVQYLLFSGEAKLTEPVTGTSNFTHEFSARGPHDRRGRSLFQLDVRHRLFRYPCSYLIYSTAFDAMPPPVKEYVWRRLWDVLTGKETDAAYAHLAAEDRRAILEIVRDTKAGLPNYWAQSPASARP
jgi:hypothetical protein